MYMSFNMYGLILLLPILLKINLTTQYSGDSNSCKVNGSCPASFSGSWNRDISCSVLSDEGFDCSLFNIRILPSIFVFSCI